MNRGALGVRGTGDPTRMPMGPLHEWQALVQLFGQRSFNGPFVERHWHWMAVVVLQRLLMVLVSVFINTDVAISLGIMLISLYFLLCQLLAKPYSTDWVNTLQLVANTCLLGLTILNSTTSVFLSVGFEPIGTPLERIQRQSDILMFVLLVVPPISFGLLKAREISHQRSVVEGGVEKAAVQRGTPS